MTPSAAHASFFTGDRAHGLLGELREDRVPSHVAVIMDGNGRWATGRGLPRAAGHRAGAAAIEESLGAAIQLGVRYLTIYSFSSENWRRPALEVAALMTLFVEVLEAKMPDLQAQDVRVRVIGRLDGMRPATAQAFRRAMDVTKDNAMLDLIVALNYGGRNELLDAAASLATDVRSGALAVEDITEDAFVQRLSTAGIPDPDLLVRTAGEQRVSNFLLWQIAYAELYFTDVLWPDFDRTDFLEACVEYQRRERRFGGR